MGRGNAPKLGVTGRTTGVRAAGGIDGVRSATKAGSGARDRLRVSTIKRYRASTARLAAGDRADRARARGAPPRAAHPPRPLSHHRDAHGEKKRRGGDLRRARRAPRARRAATRREGRTVRVLVGAPRAFASFPEPLHARARRGARAIRPATHAPAHRDVGGKKTLAGPYESVCARSGGRGAIATSLARTSTSQNSELTSSSPGRRRPSSSACPRSIEEPTSPRSSCASG